MTSSFRHIFWLPVAVAAGLLLPVQFAVNAALSRANGSVVQTGFTSYLVGALSLATLVLLTPAARNAWPRVLTSPKWTLGGGLLGSAYVLGSVLLTRELGAGLAITLVIAAQTVASVLIDHFGWLGVQRRPFGRARVQVMALLLAAVALRAWGAR